MLQAAIFDMDGLMIDSEPYWQQAQLEVFPLVDVPISRQDTIDTTGIRIDQIVQQYYQQYPWQNYTCEQICDMILAKVIELVQIHKPMMPGLLEALAVCQQQGLKLALASSSPMVLIQATLQALKLENTFSAILSAEKLAYGKPHPEVYLNAAQALNVAPQNCIALEDSFTGLLAAKAAQMKTIVIPETSQSEKPHFVIADHKLSSLEQVSAQLLAGL